MWILFGKKIINLVTLDFFEKAEEILGDAMRAYIIKFHMFREYGDFNFDEWFESEEEMNQRWQELENLLVKNKCTADIPTQGYVRTRHDVSVF